MHSVDRSEELITPWAVSPQASADDGSALRDELGVSPSAETTQLFRALT